jgi:hypothetical protein
MIPHPVGVFKVNSKLAIPSTHSGRGTIPAGLLVILILLHILSTLHFNYRFVL